MATEETRTGISRRQLIKRGAVVGGAAIWVPPVVQSLRLPAYAQVGSPPPVTCIVDGRMTGGGFVNITGGKKVSYELRVLDCPPVASSPELKVSWKIGNGQNATTYDFELLTFTSRTCSDNPGIPNGPNANFDTVVGTGTGTLTVNGVPQNGSIQFGFVDAGEGNNSGDTVTLIINNASNVNVLNIVNQLVDGGNLQALDGNFASGDACP